jgi:hypothetical protein
VVAPSAMVATGPDMGGRCSARCRLAWIRGRTSLVIGA